jgi:iron complex outermembrane receptor protein
MRMLSRLRRPRPVHLGILCGSASFFILGAALAADQGQPVEEVLITGSLIRGVQPVGVPVNALGDQEFQDTGALTISDMLLSIPTLVVGNSDVTGSGPSRDRDQGVQIHGLGTTDSTESLMLINSMRYPNQGANPARIDPSIIPQLAVQRIDVLATGASATYGSDAVAGVINVILKRGYDGAITAMRFGMSPEMGNEQIMFSQLYGRTWATGGITLTYEFWEERKAEADRDYLTRNFEPFGLDDRNSIASNMPGVVTTGAPAAPPGGTPTGFSPGIGTRFCNNCFSIPPGTGWDFDSQAPGPTISWTALMANKGVTNQRNPYDDAWLFPAHQRNAAVLTFDQQIFPGISLFADAFYSNRRSSIYYPTGNSPANLWTTGNGVTVPTTNPYYPSGAPAGLRIHYTMGVESPYRESANENAGRYAFGFDFDDLPFEWAGRVYYSMSRGANTVHSTNSVNFNMFSAALGNTVPSRAADGTTPGQSAFVKPANIPFLNVFCDALVHQCNSEITLDYIRGWRNRASHWNVGEFGLNFDGPIFELPGGPLRLALAANKISNHFAYQDSFNNSTNSTAIINSAAAQYEQDTIWAMMGEINVPIFGEMNRIPLFERLVFTAAYRLDKYNYLSDWVKTPKFGLDWGLGYGLTLHANWGTAFRAPNFAERGEYAGSRIIGVNTLGGGTSDTHLTNCAGIPGSPAGSAVPGSLTAALNPTCLTGAADPTGQFSRPGGIQITGGGGVAAATVDPGGGVGPSEATSWALGGMFAPTEGILTGIVATATYYNIKIENQLGVNNAGVGPNDPDSFSRFIVIPNPAAPITDPSNAAFQELVLKTAAHPRSTVDPAAIQNIKFIENLAITNVGYLKISGIEFDTRYDFDAGNTGTWHVGFNGVYRLTDERQALPTVPVNDAFEGKNSGGRLRGRGRVGWTDGTFNVTGFVNYTPHGAVDTEFVPPACYWAVGFGPGSCYPGSPYVGPHDVFPNFSPAQYLFDLSLGYQTGTDFTNPYLHNIAIQFTVNNLLDRRPPFHYDTRGSSGTPRAYDRAFSPAQRTISLALTKLW